MPPNQGIYVVKPGQADVGDLPYPKIRGPEWVIVEPTALAVNPTDWYHVDFDGYESCEGCLMGYDFAGKIVEIAPGAVHDFKQGDRVFGSTMGGNLLDKSDGCFARYFEAKVGVLVKTPDNLTDEEAATQGVAIFTTGQSFYNYFDLPLLPEQVKKPASIFIYGGSTATGISGIQFAKLSGLKVITTASPANAQYLKSLGADFVFDYRSPDLIDDVRKAASGEIDFVWDCRPSDESAALCAKVLSTNGNAKYNTLLPFTAPLVKELNSEVEVSETLMYSAFGEPWFYKEEYPPTPADYEFAKKIGKIARSLLAEGKLKAPNIILNRGGQGFEGVLHGMEELRRNRVSAGKLVYTL